MKATKNQLNQVVQEIEFFFAGGGQVLEQDDFDQIVENAGITRQDDGEFLDDDD